MAINQFVYGVAIAAMAGIGIHANANAQAISEGFNDITQLAAQGWLIQNNSTPVGSTTWFQGTATTATPTPGPFNAYAGAANAYIGVNFNSTGSTGTISNWLMAPNRTFRNGDVLTFYTRKATIGVGQTDYPDRLEVRLSTNGASTNTGTGAAGLGDFTTLLLSVNPSLVANVYPQIWTQYTITISGLPAPTSGRAAFRYFVTGAGALGTNSDYIGIDEFAYTPYVCPAFTMTPGGALAGGAFGQAYSTPLSQTGALGAPNYAITGGALPSGLILSAAGTISGSPTATGTFNFTTTVNDASGCSGSQAYSITVQAGPQTIDFQAASPASQSFAPNGTFAINPPALASSGLPVSYASNTTSVCTVSGSTVTTLSTGTCTIEATQDGDLNYTQATAVSQNIEIVKAAQSIAFTSFIPATPKAGGSHDVAATGGGSGNAVTFAIDSSSAANCSINGNTVSFDAAGTCTIHANQLGNANYEDADPQQQVIEIGQAGSDVIITPPSSPAVAGQALTFTVTVAFNANKSLAVQQKAAPLPTGTVEIMDGTTSLGMQPLVNGSATITTDPLSSAGTYSITAQYSGDANYPAEVSEVYTLTVVAAAVNATPVPTLNKWALMLMSVVFVLMGLMRLRRRRN